MKNEKTKKSLGEMIKQTNQMVTDVQPRVKKLYNLGYSLRYNSEFRSEVIQKNSDILGKYSEKEVCDILNICATAMCELSNTLRKDKNQIPSFASEVFFSHISSTFYSVMVSRDIQSLLNRISTEEIEIHLSIGGSNVRCKFI